MLELPVMFNEYAWIIGSNSQRYVESLGEVFGSRLSDDILYPLYFPAYCEYFRLSALSLGIGQAGHRELNCFWIKAAMLYIIKL